jgi:DNA-binding XRE family transcriptional regulator
MVNKIKKLRKEFEISQEYLSKVMEISRPTFVKIENGERKIKNSEKEKMEVFFDSLKLDEKKMRIDIPEKNEEKFQEVLLYILNKVGAKSNIGMTVIYKLLYFIDFDFYEKYQKQLMGLTYFKNTHGPSPREFKKFIEKMEKEDKVEKVKSSYFGKEQKKFLPHQKANLGNFSAQELKLIDSVLIKYSDKTASEISEISHRDMP